MENTKIKQLLEELENLKQKSITVIQKGFISNCIKIEKMNYNFEYDIIKIQDENNETYIKINTNQIYEIDKKEKEICLSLDNDIQIEIRT